MIQNDPKNRQRGAALIICLVLLVFLGTLSSVVIKTVLDDRREARTELFRQQVRILQQDGLRRAEIRRQTEPDFAGETIELKAADNPGVFRLKSIYNEETKTFGVETVFQDKAGKTVFAQKTE
jgi:Tfp pilus assembly protein PilX